MSYASARSVFRSAALRNSATKFCSAPKSAPRTFSFSQLPKQSPTTASPLFRRSNLLRTSSVCVESMMPYHTATASSLLNSMLSVTPNRYGWTPEDCNDDV